MLTIKIDCGIETWKEDGKIIREVRYVEELVENLKNAN